MCCYTWTPERETECRSGAKRTHLRCVCVCLCVWTPQDSNHLQDKKVKNMTKNILPGIYPMQRRSLWIRRSVFFLIMRNLFPNSSGMGKEKKKKKTPLAMPVPQCQRGIHIDAWHCPPLASHSLVTVDRAAGRSAVGFWRPGAEASWMKPAYTSQHAPHLSGSCRAS